MHALTEQMTVAFRRIAETAQATLDALERLGFVYDAARGQWQPLHPPHPYAYRKRPGRPRRPR
jgi:hypothetical protein